MEGDAERSHPGPAKDIHDWSFVSVFEGLKIDLYH